MRKSAIALKTYIQAQNHKLEISSSCYEDSGQAIMEVIVAMVILMVALLGLIEIFVSADSTNLYLAQRQSAVNIASAEMSRVISSESVQWNYTSTMPSSLLTIANVVVGGTTYSITNTYQNCPSGELLSSSSLKVPSIEVTIQVSWDKGKYSYSTNSTLSYGGSQSLGSGYSGWTCP